MRGLFKHVSKVPRKAIISESPEAIKVIGEIVGAKKVVEKSWLLVFEKDDVILFSYGFGSPSLALALEEMTSTNVKCIVKIDKCKSLVPSLKALDVVIAKAAIANDGFTKSRFPQGFPACADPELFVQFKDIAKVVLLYTSDIYYGRDKNLEEARKYGASCIDYSTSALYALSNYYGIKAVSLCVVAENMSNGERGVIEDVEERLVKLGIDVFERLSKVTC